MLELGQGHCNREVLDYPIEKKNKHHLSTIEFNKQIGKKINTKSFFKM